MWNGDVGEWVAADGSDGVPPPPKRWPRPRGAAPKGSSWDYEAGHWVPRSGEEESEEEPPAKRACTATAVGLASASATGDAEAPPAASAVSAAIEA